MYNKKGAIHFIHLLTTSREKKFIEMPTEIRKLIWKYLHTYPFITCYICDKLLINLNVRIDQVVNENYIIINGITKCNNCFID